VYPRPDGTVYVCGSGGKIAPLPEDPGNVEVDEEVCGMLERVAGRVCGALTAVEKRSACYLPEV